MLREFRIHIYKALNIFDFRCLAPAKMGETVILDAEVIKTGRSIAFTEATLSRKSDQVIVATGQHTKAFPSQKS